MADLRIIALEDAADSDKFVAEHPRGTIYHTKAICAAQRIPSENEVHAFAAVDEHNQVRGILTAVLVSSVKGVLSRFASRSVMYAEPIVSGDEYGVAALSMLIEHHDQTMRTKALFAEVRPFYSVEDERSVFERHHYKLLGYHNYELDTEVNRDQLWQQLRPTCRTDVRRSLKRGVVIREGNLSEDLNRFYELIKTSYARSRVPLANKRFFAAVAESLPTDRLRLTFAEFEGQTIATTCFLNYGKRAIYWYGGVRRVRGIAANSCLLWDAIHWSHEAGFRVLDFGGAGWEGIDYGPGRFKSQFGGVRVSHGRYRRIYGKCAFQIARTAYELKRRLMPTTAPAA